jgi:hypothetical protein
LLLKLKKIKITKEIKRFITEVAKAIALLKLKFLELSEIIETISIPIMGTNNNDISNI